MQPVEGGPPTYGQSQHQPASPYGEVSAAQVYPPGAPTTPAAPAGHNGSGTAPGQMGMAAGHGPSDEGHGQAEKRRRKDRPKIGTYAYRLNTAMGVKLRGKVRAASPEQAAMLIGQPGAEIVKLRRQSDFLQMEIGPRRIKGEELVIFTRQLAAFVRAGVPMIDALGSIGGENASRNLQDTLREISLDLAEGMPLSQAVAQHPTVFPTFYADLVRAGEATGSLDVVLDSAAKYLARQEEAKKKVRSALIYPAVIGIFAILTVTVLLTYVMPKFVTFFEEFNAELPMMTKILLGISDFVSRNLAWIGLGLLVAIGGGYLLVKLTPPGRRSWDWLKIHLPLLGVVVRYSIIERFCATLATMVTAGVPLVTTFSVVIDGAKNVVFQRSLKKVQEQMLIGQGMSAPVAATGLFPPIVPQMMRVGEDTGTLDEQLRMAEDFFGQELDYRLAKFTAVFEPLMIVFMGVVVGFVALAIVSAMYGIFRQVKLQ